MPAVLLFDLDDTLVVEDAAATAAFAATAEFAAARYDLDAAALAAAVRSRARELWNRAPTHPYCLRVGISSSEGLWCRFESDDREARALRAWSPAYRREAWGLALAEQGVRDVALAEEAGERFAAERRERHEVFSDAAAVLSALGTSHTLGLVTNGASCLQREKLAASGLGEHFAAIVVSAEVGVGKPDARSFRKALSELGCEAADAVMVGDSLSRDVDGALAAGLGAVWVNRSGPSLLADRPEITEISTLSSLPAVLP